MELLDEEAQRWQAQRAQRSKRARARASAGLKLTADGAMRVLRSRQ